MSKQSSDDLDHDPTVELPVLLETGVLDERGAPLPAAPSAEDTSEHTAVFVGAGDAEGSHAAELGAEAAERAARIQALEADIRLAIAAGASLEGEKIEIAALYLEAAKRYYWSRDFSTAIDLFGKVENLHPKLPGRQFTRRRMVADTDTGTGHHLHRR